MAFGTLKCDTIENDNSQSITVADLVTLNTGKANLSGATFTGDVILNAQEEVRWADSDSSNYIAFKAPGTVSTNSTWTLPSDAPAAGEVLKVSSVSSNNPTLEWGSDVGGKLLKVVQVVKTDTWSATSTSNSDIDPVTGLSITITPSSSDSRIFIQVSAMTSNSFNTCYTYWNIFKDGSFIDRGDDSGSTHQRVAFQNSLHATYDGARVHLDYLDEPGDTNSHTYQLYGNAQNGNTAYVNRTGNDSAPQSARGYSTITVFELAPN
tara:strand:- start:711 stop:1505 length:795 start_codon:yes stop_codon:yes gene_type:complete